MQRGLRGAVAALAADGPHARDRANERKRAAGFAEGGCGLSNDQKRVTQDQIELPVPVLFAEVCKRTDDRHAHDIDHAVDASEGRLRLGEHRSDACGVSRIGRKRDPAGGRCCRFGKRRFAIDTQHVRPCLRQRVARCKADAPAGAKDDSPSPLEREELQIVCFRRWIEVFHQGDLCRD